MRFLVAVGAMLIILSAGVGSNAAGSDEGIGRDVDPVVLSVVEAINNDPAHFGVPYLDDNGILVIPYIGKNAGRAAIDSLLTADAAVRWEAVAYSQSELRAVRSAVSGLRLEGVSSVSSGTNRNRVLVRVLPWGSVDKVAEALRGYGDIVVVEAATDLPLALACTDRYSCTRWRGGIAIYRNSDGAKCTWGFQANRNGNLIMVTAGHCHMDGGKFNHDGVTIGTNGVSKNGLNPATFEGIDASRTWANGTYWPTPTNPGQNVLYDNDYHKSWTMTSTRANAGFFVGMYVQKAGSTTNLTDGYVDDVETEEIIYGLNPGDVPYYPDCYIYDQSTCPQVTLAHSDTWIAPGDSGAPVHLGNIFVGIVSAGGGDGPGGGGSNMYFSRQQDVKDALGLDFWCTTAGCP